MRDKETKKPLEDGMYVRENTGMAGVIPAWKIAELLNCEEFMEKRNNDKRELADAADRVSLDDAGDQPEATFTKKKFEDALRKVSRKIHPERK